jgi:hypothetical protein
MEEDCLAPLGGPLITSLGFSEVDTPYMGNPQLHTRSAHTGNTPPQNNHNNAPPPRTEQFNNETPNEKNNYIPSNTQEGNNNPNANKPKKKRTSKLQP